MSELSELRTTASVQRKKRRNPHAVCAIVALAGAAPACNAVSGIEDLSISAAPSDGLRDAESAAPNERPRNDAGTTSNTDAATNPEDSGAIVDDGGIVTTVTKRVFVTNGKTKGNFGILNSTSDKVLAFADNMCTTAATNAKLGGNWVAWLSTSAKDAIDRLTFEGPYVRLDGATVVAKKSDLATGTLLNPIDVTETKGTPTVDIDEIGVWTGTNIDGKMTNTQTTCNNWKSSMYGAAGDFDATNGFWTNTADPADCDALGHLYCFEK